MTTKLNDITKQVEALKKGKLPNSQKVDLRKYNKRHPDSGRKPKEETLIKSGVKRLLDMHINEDDTLTVRDVRTGKTVQVTKPRIVFVLEKLYRMGMKDEGNHEALGKWLDRALGKAPQTLRGGDEDDAPLRIDVSGFEGLLGKAYGKSD